MLILFLTVSNANLTQVFLDTQSLSGQRKMENSQEKYLYQVFGLVKF